MRSTLIDREAAELEAHSAATQPSTFPSHDDRSAAASQQAWSTTSLPARLHVLQRARFALAARAEEFAGAISPNLQRSRADTLAAEVLPLLDACRFLERNAPRLLATRRLGRKGRPFWLTGVTAEVERVPLGQVLIIAPGNFPLLLPGVQALQALAAGNVVIWKPGVGGEPVARLFAETLRAAGLPAGLLQVTGEDAGFATRAIASGPDKVIFTGSSDTGRRVLEQLAPRLIPATLELSGTDAVLVLASADLPRVAKAISFGLRLNGSAVCMSPRRLFATASTLQLLLPLLRRELDPIPPTRLDPRSLQTLETSLADAVGEGATVEGAFCPEAQRPLLIHGARPEMRITRETCFAPVLALIEARAEADLPTLHNRNPYGLAVSIFGEPVAARKLADPLRAGSVLINDLIVPTADPRLPFGGLGESGYGVTRGAEGLLEMTRVKVVQVRHNRSTRHYDPIGDREAPLFAALIRLAHGRGPMDKARALKDMFRSANQRKQKDASK